ncbi:tRNA dihydrouridine(16) synthase DusC [Moraxella caviae]|uniref:tRNA-dihydrouridine(16) synthase n=1 Tax=Moraxella caviae TaxID=34060 RepID=A0A1T0A879_9GAMM|nr:tRNA-dihydrouridine synthase [Moraxella caviae]OOR91880.1 tRNA dihydrouridine(16) synthase DusC [Moraxella caviae]STZ09730.1 Probable tRNA-dihydrouridine synthase [Moraxella caviae]VEW11231.1 Probable tRNA-dihydrouridine synthase [Moraxella caviae]
MQDFHSLFAKPVRLLAPMEGLTDPLMRRILTRLAQDLGAPYDWSVSEFIRVTHYPLPAHVFYKYVPELRTAGKTASGTPIHVQLLGNNPDTMAQSAVTAVSLGAPAIDLNFGCPAKTVNNHKGGSVLLEEPETLYTIISAVRAAVPAHIPVSAKIRLGYTDTSKMHDIGQAVQSANASWLTVHARTKTQGYKPPAYWELIRPFTELGLPVIANGEIWNAAHAQTCVAQSGTPHLMLGRGAVTRPDLIAAINHACVADDLNGDTLNNANAQLTWDKLVAAQKLFLADNTDNQSGLIGRYKQWLGMLTKGYAEADALWHDIKKLKDKAEIVEKLESSVRQA